MYVIESKFFVFPWVEWICIFLLNEGVAVDVWICAATFLWCETPGEKQCEKIMMASLCVIWYDYLLLLLELTCCENVPEVRLWERPLAIKMCFCLNCASFFFSLRELGKTATFGVMLCRITMVDYLISLSLKCSEQLKLLTLCNNKLAKECC